MKIRLILLAAVVSLSQPSRAAEEPSKPETTDLPALATHAQNFVKAYNNADAAGLAGLFLPNGEIVLANGELIAGREEIAGYYSRIFAGPESPKAALETGSVRLVTPELAIEDGTFHVTQPSGEVGSHFYTAVLAKQKDGTWLTASIRDELEDRAPAPEKLVALEWMIGDWLIERDGSRTFLAFTWSEDGPFIDGRAVTEQAGVSSTSSTYRIGWDPARKDFVSWAFDALGGHTRSEWTTTDAGWLLRTRGVTADGEVNESTQSIQAEPSLEGFVLNTRDQTIAGVALPETTVRVVKRPPAPDEIRSTGEPSDP